MTLKRTETRKRSQKTEDLVERLKERGISSITEFLNLRAQSKGFANYGEYRRALDAQKLSSFSPEIAEEVRKSIVRRNTERTVEIARQKGHKNPYQRWKANVEERTGKSLKEHQDELARDAGYADAKDRKNQWFERKYGNKEKAKLQTAIRKGHSSVAEHSAAKIKALYKRLGVKSNREYNDLLAKVKHNCNDYKERKDRLAQQKGYSCHEEYLHAQSLNRQQRPEYILFSHLVRTGLKSTGMNQEQLAETLGVDRAAVSRYCHGTSIPRQKIQEVLFAALQLPYRTFDDYLTEIEEAALASGREGTGKENGKGNEKGGLEAKISSSTASKSGKKRGYRA